MTKNVVVVDDEERVREIYRQLLTRAGLKVLEAGNAHVANEIIKTHKVDLVLLDLKMPDVPGSIFFEVLKAFHREAKVIVTSVYPLDEQKSMIEGADDYYDKSQGITVLMKKIKDILEIAPAVPAKNP